MEKYHFINRRQSMIAEVTSLRTWKDSMKRVGLQFKVRPDGLVEDKEHHKNVRYEMLGALRETGWHNYTLFMRSDGFIFGYFETEENLTAAQPKMQQMISTHAGRNSCQISRIPTYDLIKPSLSWKNISTWIEHDTSSELSCH